MRDWYESVETIAEEMPLILRPPWQVAAKYNGILNKQQVQTRTYTYLKWKIRDDTLNFKCPPN